MAINAQEMLDKYLEAEAAILLGKTTIFNGRTHTMAELPQIQAGRREWERRVIAQRAAAQGSPGYALAEFR
ncbi:primosomal replication protein PriB/PriC domain protein [Pseudomonas sp. VS40]|uniref:Primosomal replication protein PriB/PriC domain protein n=1 Tax=Pseudomonas lurida TaxID=244566 RepID=A0ABY9FNH4_9PSED|nr:MULTISPECIES: primosomal replication protein PriB/PriC domain protein [Pseudomonas]MBT1262515.1 primosomal replication protein PriB/PriC domain protein [Pseudomonas sp. VS40]MBT1274548.1 primosomal replication protein PriB/PriC domain protein [Pseudomonas sp. VS59]WLH04830.1 primosomal replication protein PriB/PriC domain protein [Pseudomonas lurida]